MASQANQPHFILFPLMAQGHMIPVIDIAKLLAQHGVLVTIITTPINANRMKTCIDRAIEAGLQIRVIELYFPCVEVGLPEGCENLDMLPSVEYGIKFFVAIGMLQQPVEQLLGELKPRPSCIISDMCLPWTNEVARKLHIPRLVFCGTACLSLLCTHNILTSKVLDNIASESEYFVVPDLPDRIEYTKAQLPMTACPTTSGLKDLSEQMREADLTAFGMVVNTFEELEPEYVKEYRKVKGGKVWCIGPVSLCNKDESDKADRGIKASIDENHCLKWLDSWEPSSVVYACLGSLYCLATPQMIELGLGLEASNRPFIWAIGFLSPELEKWLEDGIEERIKGRGLVIRGWAPQVLILSHPSVGGFLTHSGWNSTLEAVSAGVPMMTWPMYAEHFYNEKLVDQVLKIGVKVGVQFPIVYGEGMRDGEVVKRDDVKMFVDRLMDEGEEGEERRKRAKEIGEIAKGALEEGGSSHLNMAMLIEDVMEWNKQNKGNQHESMVENEVF